jgi:hypothetical protein
VAATGIAGALDSERTFVVTVPAGARRLVVRTADGTGDVDVYVRRGAPATDVAWDCASTELATAETCEFESPAAGEWYVTLFGYTAYSGVTVTATVTTGAVSADAAPSRSTAPVRQARRATGKAAPKLVGWGARAERTR